MSDFRLWLIVDEARWAALQQNGRLQYFRNFTANQDQEAYDWMVQQMQQRLFRKGQPEQYPIWAWYQYQSRQKRKPDLRYCGHLPKGQKGYRLEISKTKTRVLLSDFVAWHHVSSYRSYYHPDPQRIDAFERMINQQYHTLIFEQLPPKVRQEIRWSWEHIFLPNDEDWLAKHCAQRMIQATFWDLFYEDVLRAEGFRAR